MYGKEFHPYLYNYLEDLDVNTKGCPVIYEVTVISVQCFFTVQQNNFQQCSVCWLAFFSNQNKQKTNRR